MKILVVEDTEDARILLIDLLSSSGYEVLFAKNGLEALEILETSQLIIPDLIISDILMPVMDGFELCRNIKKQPLLKSIPFIFYTATYTEPSDQDFALSLGADLFIIKPEDSVKLLNSVKTLLTKHQSSHITQASTIDEFDAQHSNVLSRKLDKKIEDIKSQKRQLQIITDTMPTFIAEVDENSTFQYVNNTCVKWFRLPRHDIIGKKVSDIFSNHVFEIIRSHLNKAINGEEVELEDYIPDLDGVRHYVHARFIPHKNNDGIVCGCFLFINDLTDRKNAEEEKQELLKQLHHSQRMNAIDKLSGGIAHDFNNQLGIIIGYLDLMKLPLESNEKLSKWISIASKASLRCEELTRQLLSFSRNQTVQKLPVNINSSIESMKSMISRSVTPKIGIEYHLDKNLWSSFLNNGELQDTILNIVINARDAMPNGGTLYFITRNIQFNSDTAPISPEMKPGDYVEITISDTGEGMNKETLERLFEPFYTTKSVDEGTGLGMAMVYGFTKRYGGQIKINSELQSGTTITIFLPRHKNTVEDLNIDNELTSQITTLPTGVETILIVDDEDELLNLSNNYLQDLGYHTHTAKSADEALLILKKKSDIDLIFSDIVMPGTMNGYELIEKAIEIKPQIKYLLTSGFISKTIKINRFPKYTSNLLIKPYRKETLAQNIRTTLDKGTPILK